MIRIENIHKSYDELKVLKGVNLSINQGDVISIVGASGAGKSTLLQIIGTLDLPDEGTVKINDVIANSLNDSNYHYLEIRTLVLFFNFITYYLNLLL